LSICHKERLQSKDKVEDFLLSRMARGDWFKGESTGFAPEVWDAKQIQ